MPGTIEVLPPNTLSLDEHVEKITTARDKVRAGTFEFAIAIADACDQLDYDTQSTLADRLGMDQPAVSKWREIGSHPLIMGMQDNLPPTFGSLYDLTRLEKKYLSHYGVKKGATRFAEVFSKDKITGNSQRKDVINLLDDVDRRIKNKKTKQNQAAILSLGGQQLANPTTNKKSQSIDQLLKSKLTFKSFLIIPDTEQIRDWGAMDFEDDISQDFPLLDLRHTSHLDALQCLIKVPVKDIPTGLKCLEAFGFEYRDMLLPSQKNAEYEIRKNEDVLIRGERGRGKVTNMQIKGDTLDAILDYIEDIGSSPYLVVGERTDRKDWMICKV